MNRCLLVLNTLDSPEERYLAAISWWERYIQTQPHPGVGQDKKCRFIWFKRVDYIALINSCPLHFQQLLEAMKDAYNCSILGIYVKRSRNILVTITHSSTDNTGLYNVSTSELRMMRQRRFSVVFTLLLQHLQSYLNLPSSITISSIWPTSSSTSRCAFRGRYKVANTEFHTFAVCVFFKDSTCPFHWLCWWDK